MVRRIAPEPQERHRQPLAPAIEPRPLEVEAVLSEFDGDARAAIAALLHDLDLLARDAAATTSRGYVRGCFFRLRPLPEDRRG